MRGVPNFDSKEPRVREVYQFFDSKRAKSVSIFDCKKPKVCTIETKYLHFHCKFMQHIRKSKTNPKVSPNVHVVAIFGVVWRFIFAFLDVNNLFHDLPWFWDILSKMGRGRRTQWDAVGRNPPAASRRGRPYSEP